MKSLSSSILAAAALLVSTSHLHAYERLQGPTEVLYWNKTNAYTGYTFFGVRSNTYLLSMEGRVVHTWPLGTNPRLLTNGNILDATSGDVSGFTTLKEVDWNGSTVWQYTEARTNYAPHHDFTRIYNPKLGTNTTLYIAAKTVSSNACIAAGCNPANGPYTNAQLDAIVEVDMAGNVVWEWCFFDHGIQDFDASKSNYVGTGKSISNYVGRLNLNLPGRPVTNDSLHCNAIDYNQTLDQIVITAAGGEFYVIDHGNTFVAGNPASSIALAASTNGDFLYRFGDPARYSQGNPPSINQNWTTSTTGNKQIGGASHAQWIASGLPGAGQFLVYNNGGDLFETTPQSYIFQLNGYLNASTNDTGAYVNPPTASYNNWAAPGHDTDKRTKSMSRQITWMYYSMANQGMFSHLDSSVQRLPNGNTLICDSTEGHIFEVTATGDAVWEYINPVSADGIITYKRDSYPMQNAVFRAYRFATNHPAFAGRTLKPVSTISGQLPSYISAPTISGTTISPAIPTAASSVWVTSLVTNSRSVASATLTYIVGTSTNTVTMLDDGAHQDGATGDGVFGGQIPAQPAGTLVRYFLSAQDDFGNIATDPTAAPGTTYSYTVQTASSNLPPAISAVANTLATVGNPVWVTCRATDDVSVASVTLNYGTGSVAGATNLVFLETMGAAAAKPWTGTGCDYVWTVAYSGTKNPYEQSTNANYGAGNAYGLIFKNSSTTTNLADNSITTAGSVDARGSAGSVEFYLRALWQTNTESWTFQLDSGSGFITRTGEVITATHATQLYHYDLQPSELVSNLTLRFQFQSDPVATNNRIYLDDIAVKVVGSGGTSWTSAAMLDDGAHQDGVAGDGTYGGQIPAFPLGTTVSYYVAAADTAGLSVTNPTGAPVTTYSYTVTTNAPTIAGYNLVLGRPTDHSMTVSLLASNDLQVYLEYGTSSGTYSGQTMVTNVTAGAPLEVLLGGLSSNTRYYYRLRYKLAADTNYLADAEHTFVTQRLPGSTFTFAVQGDSHPERVNTMFDSALYTRTLQTAAADRPDFYLTIGDDFSVDTIPTNLISPALVTARYTSQRPYLTTVGSSAPLFLVNGNHEQAARYLLDGTSNNIAVWAQNARNTFYPEPAPDSFYTGNPEMVPYIGLLRNFYAWTWGDALFVTIDPYWGSPTCVDDNYWTGVKRTNLWDVTHGDLQYRWLKQTLEQSTAKYKFVFAHHVLGTGRGGVDEASLYEWGGQNGNGSWGFTTNRSAWPAPLHQLMVANNVSAFIQGHDHIWVQEQLDGVTYQTLPNPADPNYATNNADAFTTGVKLPNTGYTRFTVAPAGVKVEYVRTYLPADEGAGKTNGTVAYSYVILPLTISGTAHSAALPSQPVWVTAGITGGTNISQAVLTYLVGGATNTVTMADDGLHQDGAAGDSVYGGQIPAFTTGTTVRYFVRAQDAASRQVTAPSGAPFNASLFSYTVTAATSNTAPTLVSQLDRTVNPGYTLLVTNVASDADLPAQTLTFSLVNPPANASINATSGVVAFAPSFLQLGTTNLITVVVTDSGTPAMSATNRFKAIVIANTSPVLAAVANLTVSPGSLLTIANSATDAEVPPQVLTYELVDGPASATINPTTGVLTWLPTQADAGTTNDFIVVVEDNGVPSLIDWQWFTVIVSGVAAPVSYDLLLGRPTDTSVAVSVLASNDLQVYFEYGIQPGVYTNQTATTAVSNSIPSHLTLAQLSPNQRYYYRMRYSATGVALFSASPERTFVTQRSRGSTFTFDIEADPHHLDNDPPVWRVALTNMLADQPDFLIDLGDTFMDEKLGTNTAAGAAQLCRDVRNGFFSILGHSTPLFLVNGNHDPELGWMLNNAAPQDNLAVWGVQARQRYYPCPVPGAFYSGSTNTDPYVLGARDGYYAFEWGNALFVVLDPFWQTSQGTSKTSNPWSWTLGTNQYQWLQRMLSQSTATFKFVFIHHLVGGSFDGIARGGVEFSSFFEWGGYNTNGTWGFATNRPGWAMPIQSLLLSNGVNAVFHGHDHLYVKQDLDANSDGITDLVYHEVPQPSRTNYNAIGSAAAYGYTNGMILGNSGHLRVTVSPTNARVEYVRAFLPADEGAGKTNRMVSHSYTLTAPVTVTNGAWTMAKLPDTGQTQSYTATIGEDSDYTVNPPSFTDNGDGTVKDNVTGLIWQKADGGEMAWTNAVLYAQTNRVGGQSDWRLPTSHEAFSILNHGTVNPALNTTYFTSSTAQYWWTADAQVSDASRIWAINAGGGIGAHRQDETVSAGGTNRYHVRCVRGVTLSGRPVHHFTNNLDGTVSDLDTGLMWQQAESFAMNWESALQYAEALSLGGKSDWRLPNVKELQSINDETRANPSVDTAYFTSANSSRHWASTTVMNLTNRAWYVDFQLGLVSYEDKLTNLFVRCVRGGVTNTPPPATNSFAPQFVKIPAGSYQMGDHFGFVDLAHPSDEVPVHNVAVDSFYMETTLLTCTEYVQFLNSALVQGLIEVRSNYVYGVGGTNIYCDTYASDTNSRVQWSGSAFSVRDGRELHPVTGIRWFGAIAYCNWASVRDGFSACYNLATGDCSLTNNGYRLPTEAEWEYAARGGLYNPYGMFPWGSDTNADGTLANWAGKTNPFTTGAYPWTTPVGFYNGSLQSKTNFNWPSADATYQTRNNMNGFGLYDMSGNVWEWINDWYANNYYTNCVLNNIVTNPPGPVTGDLMPDGKPYRGLRGGNWFNGGDQYGHARVANRNPSYYRGPGDPNGPWFHIGFRVMRRGYTSVVATGATLTNLASGLHFTEGPAADAAGNVFFSDIPADTIYKWSVSNQLAVFRTNSGGANGLFFDAIGNLVACEGDNGRITSITPQGSVSVLASNYAGLRFNEPNDLWIDPAGGVYFTDPTYFGHAVAQGGEYVYYLKPDRSAVLRIVSDTVRPNGLVGTPDGKTLYLADWGATNVFRYGINADCTLTNKTSFARVKCDGMTLDAEGNLYFCESAVLVYDSAGNQVEQIAMPERPTNLEFGGSDRKTLFITTDAGSLYSLRMRVAGATNAVVSTNQAPVITNVALSPVTPTTNDTVWVTARVADDVSVAGVTLSYSTGGGGASQTNTVFLETMGSVGSKPWTGSNCNNAWTVTGSVCEQRDTANYGAGNTNGLEFKGGTTNLTDNMIATTSAINAQGSSGFVEFWMQTLTISNQYNNAGWTFQLDAGSGYITRLSELASTNHGWTLYHYNLQTSELTNSLKMRFQFRGGSTESRMDLDQISVKVVTGGGGTSTNVVMLDDGTHHDGVAGDGTYGASIPPRPAGTTVNYYLTASDNGGLTTTSPVGAPASTFSYTVQTGTSNTPPVIASATISPSSPTATNSVWVTAQVTDNVSVATVTLTYNAGAGAVNVTMLDDGLHQDGAAGDRTYGGQIPAFSVGTTVSCYLTATDNQGAVSTDPVGAPASAYSYTVRSTSTTQTVGLFLNTTNAWPGYTLMAPMHHTNTYLINNDGQVVHRWQSTYEPGRSAYLMTNGHLFRAGMVKQGGPSTGGGEGGRIEEYDWDGNLVWAIDYFSPTYIHHHDFKILPNGNVLLLVAEKKTLAEVIAAGFNTNLLDASIFTQGYMLPDCLVEVTPTRPYGGTVVWEWHLWDHMIQDYDPTKNNYGVVADHPELIDVNGTGMKIPQFWNHVNGIDHNVQLDQVMLSIRGNSELFVIDHQLTTAQAASHTSGRYNKGGDILYRWGNPAQYNRGTAGNQQLYQQHHTHWIETNCPGAGNILIFNNGIGRGYSTINQIVPPVDAAGNYTINAGAAFGPTTPVWTYQSSPATNFYSAEISGAQRLPNGNTLICEGIKGNLFEVTAAGQTVWRYLCPVASTILTQGDSIPVDQARTDQFMNAVFRVDRYATNFVGFIGRDLTPQGTIEIPVDQTVRIVNSQSTSANRRLGWSSMPDVNYAVLYKATLATPSWTTISTNRSLSTLTYFTDTNAVRLIRPEGFYRILRLQ